MIDDDNGKEGVIETSVAGLSPEDVSREAAGIRQQTQREGAELLEIELERATPETIDMQELAPLIQSFVEGTFAPDLVEEELELNLLRAKRLISGGKFHVAMHQGEIVGFGGFDHYGYMSDGNRLSEVCELAQVYTVDRFRGGRVFSRLLKQMIDDFEAENPDNVMISVTENQHVLSSLYREGFEDFDPDLMHRMYSADPGRNPSDLYHEGMLIESKKKNPAFGFVMRGGK